MEEKNTCQRSQRNCERYLKVPKLSDSKRDSKFLANRSARSFFTTDIAIIRNTNAMNAVIAVYPFTPPAPCDYQSDYRGS